MRSWFPLALLLCLLAGSALAADNLRPPLLLTARTAALDLSGRWTYSKDLYRTGLTDINGWPAKPRMERFRDVDVAAAEAKGGAGFFEYDLDRGPAMDIPGAWNSAVPELRYFDGLMWLQRRFDAPPPKPGQRSFLRFEAVNYRAMVFLNGKGVGRHEGGFTPFVVEVTEALRQKGNRLVIGVDSHHDAQTIPAEITDWDLYGGITRPVKLLQAPATFIDDATLRLTEAGHLEGSVQLNGAYASHQTVSLRIPALNLTLHSRTDDNGEARFDAPAPAGLKRWSPEAPTLYDVDFEAGTDRVRDRIGFRTIAVRGSDILLNGRPVVLHGISIHEEEIGPNPARRIDEAAARRLLTEVKQGLGGNYVRLSHYPHNETMLRAADELGLLVWSEIPVYWSIDWETPAVLHKARRMQAETVYRDRNRAAVVLWSIGNETPVTEARTRFHTALAQTVRSIDASRLVSAALLVERKGDTIHIADPLLPQLDVVAVNTYAGWYGDDTLDTVRRLRWDVPPDKPLLFSEFGADALAGFRDPVLRRKFSEDYQADYYRATLAMAAQVPTLRGMSPWVLKDFRSPRREHPIYQNGWNRKGLISETGQRKLAFDVLAAHYRGKSTAEPFDIAITVDDLPVHGALPPGMTRLGIAEAHLQAFKAHGVPEAWGFVNAKGVQSEPGSEAALTAWRTAGQPLGNHTFSHMNLARTASTAAWEADVIAGEPVLKPLMDGADWHWFRYPNLAAGKDAAQQASALAFLKRRGYRVADVSVAFSDWDYTDAYARCVARKDEEAIARMTAHYLAGVDAGIERMKAESRAVYGRVIPQVLLTHLGGFSAATLPDVLKRLDTAGARYVTLAQAQADPAYARSGGGSLIAREARAKGVALPADPSAAPPLDLKAVCTDPR